MADIHDHPAKDHVHPGPTQGELVRLGVILAAITALEFGIVYLHGLKVVVVVGLYLLALVKFFLVATRFMHLKYDHTLLGWIFLIGALMAASMINALYYILFA